MMLACGRGTLLQPQYRQPPGMSLESACTSKLLPLAVPLVGNIPLWLALRSQGCKGCLGGGDRPVEVPLRVRQGDEPRLELGRGEVDPAGEHPVEPGRVPFRVAPLRRGVVRHRALL